MQEARREKKKKKQSRGKPRPAAQKTLGGQKRAGREDGLRNKRKRDDAANARTRQRANKGLCRSILGLGGEWHWLKLTHPLTQQQIRQDREATGMEVN